MIENLKKIKTSRIILYITYTLLLWFVLFNYKLMISILLKSLNILTPVIIGLIIAFVLNIPMNRIEDLLDNKIKKKGLLRGLSLGITLIIMIVLLLLFSAFILPKLFDSVHMLVNNAVRYGNNFIVNINNLMDTYGIPYHIEGTSLRSALSHLGYANIFKLTGNTWINVLGSTMGFFGTFFTCIISFVMSIYLLSNKEVHITQLRKLLVYVVGKKKAEVLFDLGSEANYYFKGFITGQLLEAIIFLVIIFIPFKFMKLPFPELMAFIIGFCSLIPMFGCYISFSIDLVLMLALAPSQILTYIICFVIVQQFESNIIYPRVVGNAVGISGLYVIISLTVFSSLFGFIGLLFAVPVTALIYAVASRIINIGLYRQRLEVTLTDINNLEDQMDESIPHTYRGH